MPKPSKDFWAGFGEALSKQGEVRPTGPGWKSTDDLIADKIHGKNRTNISSKMGRAARAGLLEHFSGWVFRKGKLKACAWWRPKT